MEPIWDPGLTLCSKNWFLSHGMGIPHDEFRFFSFPVVDEGHKISIILFLGRISIISLMVKNLSSRSGLSKVDLANDFLFLEVVLEHTFEEDIILSSFVFRQLFLKKCDIGELVFVADERLLDHWELH